MSLIEQKGASEQKRNLLRLERTFDVEYRDLGLTLSNGTSIMSGVSGTLRSGRTCAIMGPSGAGKTTFVTLLTGKVSHTVFWFLKSISLNRR